MSSKADNAGETKPAAAGVARPADDHAGKPLPKRAKTDDTKQPKQQLSLLNFFSSNSKKKVVEDSVMVEASTTSNKSGSNATSSSSGVKPAAGANKDEDEYKAIVPTKAEAPMTVVWETGLHDFHVILRKPRGKDPDKERTKIAAFDLDGTLLQWSSRSPGFWPSQLAHYELWNSEVITKLRDLYDHKNYRLVIFTNQGGIQKAHSGKKSMLVKSLLDWLAAKLDRPLLAVMSTRSPKKSAQSFHKPSPTMWTKVLAKLHAHSSSGTRELDLANSFFVGDSEDESDPQGGVDRKFAAAVGIQFYTPDEYFGPSHQERRTKLQQYDAAGEKPPPPEALVARSALLGGYLEGPILLILCGVQGSGKSTFGKHVLDGVKMAASQNDFNTDSDEDDSNKNNNNKKDDETEETIKWVILSQDTINNGKPGKREKVEEEARRALRQGHSVIVDRMHLDPGQRKYFVDLAAEEKVPAHIVVLNPPKHVLAKRVQNRTDHPGKVEGEQGVRLAMQSVDRLVLPSYDEAEEGRCNGKNESGGTVKNAINLISCASTDTLARELALRYAGFVVCTPSLSLFCNDGNKNDIEEEGEPPHSADKLDSIPSVSLGTMGMGRRTCTETVDSVLEVGFPAVDTAPTYNNEDKVGESQYFGRYPCKVIAKVPKRAVQPDEVRSELAQTLKKLQKGSVSLLLLHWPSDVIAADTLKEVWKTMEELYKEGKCGALGVCNFNQGALSMLLRVCTIAPVVNQVERHPLLSQLDLVDFCVRNNIFIQAHSPLGGGRQELLGHPTVTKVANESGMSPAQVVLQWNLQQGMAVVPKCSRVAHAQEFLEDQRAPDRHNLRALSPEHMQALDGMDNATRFVAPPFMYGTGAVYFWGDRMPQQKRSK